MPKAWSKRDERKYEHIKKSSKERGTGEKRAKEIAARTVNVGRREEGRTPQRTTQGTGKPGKPLMERSREELYNLAKQKGVEGRSRMNKQQLARAVGSR